MTISNRIQGVLTLTSPLHCSGGTKSSTTITVTQPVMSPNGTYRVPYFPANDIRGRLRRMAAKILVDSLKLEKKISIELLLGLTCGAISSSSENDVSIEEVLRSRDNVYMGLFGGGTRLMRSGFRVQDVIPFLEQTIESGLVPDYLGVEVPMSYSSKGGSGERAAEPVKSWQLVHEYQSIRVDDMYRVIDLTLIKNGLAEPSAEVAKYQEFVLNMRQDKKNAKAAEEAGEKIEKKQTQGLSLIFITEAIPAGTPMHLCIDLEDFLTDAQRGLILMSLRDLVNEQALGGVKRNGFGQFKADLRGTFDGENLSDDGTPNAVLVFNPKVGQYELSGIAQEYADKAMEEVAKLTMEDMWLFFKPNKKVVAEKEKAEKSAKAAK